MSGRFSEQSFRRYENWLIAFDAAYPQSYEINPEPYAVETVAARIRDAVRGWEQRRWESQLNPETFLPKWNQSEVIRKERTVLIRPKLFVTPGTIQPPPPSPPFRVFDDLSQKSSSDFTPPSKENELLVTAPSLNALRALLLLHDEGHFLKPTKVTELTEPLVDYLKNQAEFYNVGLAWLNETTCVLR